MLRRALFRIPRRHLFLHPQHNNQTAVQNWSDGLIKAQGGIKKYPQKDSLGTPTGEDVKAVGAERALLHWNDDGIWTNATFDLPLDGNLNFGSTSTWRILVRSSKNEVVIQNEKTKAIITIPSILIPCAAGKLKGGMSQELEFNLSRTPYVLQQQVESWQVINELLDPKSVTKIRAINPYSVPNMQIFAPVAGGNGVVWKDWARVYHPLLLLERGADPGVVFVCTSNVWIPHKSPGHILLRDSRFQTPLFQGFMASTTTIATARFCTVTASASKAWGDWYTGPVEVTDPNAILAVMMQFHSEIFPKMILNGPGQVEEDDGDYFPDSE